MPKYRLLVEVEVDCDDDEDADVTAEWLADHAYDQLDIGGRDDFDVRWKADRV